ncbi:MAG TPA: RDD family protein [Thermoanaerobaculia bacterium]|nr:RDD family protein [Thermoanaerobaculia bacterium]
MSARELTITTPEHVHIRLEPAGAGSRFLAILIDSVLTNGVTSLLFTLLIFWLPRGVAMAIVVTANFVLTIGWHLYFETKRQGRTPGKRALRIRVVDARGLPVSLYQSLARNMVRVLDFAPAFYGIAAISTMVSPLRRRLGDVVADTLVIRDAQPLAYRGQLASERRHNSLRTPRALRLIRHRISLEEREFLLTLCLRAEKMQAAARYDLFDEVANVYREKLHMEEEELSGENFVRALTAVLFHPKEEETRKTARSR